MSALRPEDIQSWFPPEVQQRYVAHILMQSENQAAGPSKLTDVQAAHLVKLWGYAYVKQHGSNHVPIKYLTCRLDSFFCSHSEAANLLYADRPRAGTARSAGLMLKTLESMNLIRYTSSIGSATKISLNIPSDFELQDMEDDLEVVADAFDPRRDAVSIANSLKVLFNYEADRTEAMGRNIVRGLREWAKRYPKGIRVLRQTKTKKAVAITAVFPIHPNYESLFDMPPSDSMYLTRIHQNIADPVQFAAPGIDNCCIAYIRMWHIIPGLWNLQNISLLLDETKSTLQDMMVDHPDLSDVYLLILHPLHEDLAKGLGFDFMRSDPDTARRWSYVPLDDFLELNGADKLKEFEFEPYNLPSFK